MSEDTPLTKWPLFRKNTASFAAGQLGLKAVSAELPERYAVILGFLIIAVLVSKYGFGVELGQTTVGNYLFYPVLAVMSVIGLFLFWSLVRCSIRFGVIGPAQRQP